MTIISALAPNDCHTVCFKDVHLLCLSFVSSWLYYYIVAILSVAVIPYICTDRFLSTCYVSNNLTQTAKLTADKELSDYFLCY